MALTDTNCRNLKSKATDYKVADEKGLCLLVKKETSAKYWRFNYTFEGKRQTLSMGTYPETGLKAAREKRDDARKLIANGINPSIQRKAAKIAEPGEIEDSFRALALEWLAVKEHEWAASHFSKIKARMLKDVIPFLGDIQITALKVPQILKVLREIESRGAVETAHRTKYDISQVIRYAIQTGRAENNPADHLVGVLKSPKEKHMAAITEPKQVGELLRQMDGYQGSFVVRCALALAPLVFVRPGELRQAEWAHIDLEKGEWRFKASKTHQDHIVPLSRQAIAILKSLQPFSGHGRYVFPSPRTDEKSMSNNAILAAFRRMAIDKDEMTGHGFRAMARTLLSERLRYPDGTIEHQLAHQVRDVHGRAYNRTSFLDDRKIMMQHWADYLDNLREGRDVVPPAAQYGQENAA